MKYEKITFSGLKLTGVAKEDVLLQLLCHAEVNSLNVSLHNTKVFIGD